MAEPTPRTVASSFLLLSKCTYTNRSASFLLFCPYLNLEHSQILLFAVLTKKTVLPTPSDISHSRNLSRFWNPSSLNQSKGIKPCSVAGTFWTGVTFWCMSTAAASPSSTVKIISSLRWQAWRYTPYAKASGPVAVFTLSELSAIGSEFYRERKWSNRAHWSECWIKYSLQ